VSNNHTGAPFVHVGRIGAYQLNVGPIGPTDEPASSQADDRTNVTTDCKPALGSWQRR